MSQQHFQEIRQRYIEFYVAGNAAGLAGIFTGDSLLLPPDNPIAIGSAAIQAFYEEQFAHMAPSSLSVSPEEEAVLGDWGYGAGTWTATATLKATGETVRMDGKYLNIVRRQADGGWKIHRHAWNAPTQLAAVAASQP